MVKVTNADSINIPLEGSNSPNGLINGKFGQKYYDALNSTWYICLSDPSGTNWEQISDEINATKIQGINITSDTPTDNQILIYNSLTSQYELEDYNSSTDSGSNINTTQIQGIDVTSDIPIDNQILVYNSLTSQYELIDFTFDNIIDSNTEINTTQIQGIDVTSDTPTDNQILIYNSLTSQYELEDYNSSTDSGSNENSSVDLSNFSGYINGLKIERNDNNSINILAGKCLSDNGSEIIENTETLNVNIILSGANGLDTGLATTTWYYIYIIKNIVSETVAGLLSISATNPVLPSGYDVKRRIGSIKRWNDGSYERFMYYNQHGNSNLRKYIYYENWNGDPLRVLSNGTASNFTDVDCSSIVPPTSRLINLIIMGADESIRMRYNGSTTSLGDIQLQTFVEMNFSLDENQLLEYQAISGSPSIAVLGYTEEI